MDIPTKQHVDRLKAALWETYDITDAPKWLTDHTYLNNDRFSFEGHEFQERILSDPSRVINVQKCAQLGMSEAMARYILALCKIIPNFSAILTFPYSGDAENFMRTRIDPIIRDSEALRNSINPDLDNVSIKGIDASLLYARGTSGQTQALSIPADLLVHDEIDRSDPNIIGQYQSRIRHSKWKLVRKFGTPTIAKRGISAEMDVSRRYRNLCKCQHCNYYFVPDYFEHVHIPGYLGDLKEVNKDNIRTLRWQDATLNCPKCGGVPDLSPSFREWVIENTSDNYEAVGYFCSPFDVPKMTSVPDLVAESTRYTQYYEFMNQGLGLVADNVNDQIMESDLLDSRTSVDLYSTNVHCMGADMGLTCVILIGRLVDGLLLVVHRESVALGQFEERKLALQLKYKIIVSVCDSQPYVDLILRMQQKDKNLYGGVYHNGKDLATYTIKKVDKDDAKGKLPINQALIKRDIAFDEIMYMFKAETKRIAWQAISDEEDNKFIRHCTDMKREQAVDQNGELRYTWTKSHDGIDHFHHGLLYLYTACRLMPTYQNGGIVAGIGVPILKKFAMTKPDRFVHRN